MGERMERLDWRKSRRCESIACVEVAMSGSHVWIRQSADPAQTLEFTREEWTAFLAGAKSGEFD